MIGSNVFYLGWLVQILYCKKLQCKKRKEKIMQAVKTTPHIY